MQSSKERNGPRILVVDDDGTNRLFLQKLLDIGGYDDTISADSGRSALKVVSEIDVDLIILDLHMPDMDGYEVLRTLCSPVNRTLFLPVLVFTADATTRARKFALELGANDFLTKPGNATEILLRVKNFLTMRAWHLELTQRNMDLEERIRFRTFELEQAQMEIVERLALAGEFRDEGTAGHPLRVGNLSAEIARGMGLSESTVGLIQLAARLHDIGKIGVRDDILRKPGSLTSYEYEQMKLHCRIGAEILANGKTPLVKMAERIASAHHEQYDGSGYPLGLVGDEIPLEARIVAVADAFDVMTSSRPYKSAWAVNDALSEISRQRGRQFDPVVVDVFLGSVRQGVNEYLG